MKKQLNEFKRMQLLAGIITENQLRESENLKSAPELKDGDIKDLLINYIPEDIDGSWDEEQDTFKAPFEWTDLLGDEFTEELEEELDGMGYSLEDLPTKWVKIETHVDETTEDAFEFNFYAKFIPNEGLMMGVTIEKK